MQFIDTGHQVWTTIHVHSANAIPFRLIDMGVGIAELPDQVSAQIGEDVLPHHRERLARGEVLEARPAEVLVGPTPGILAFREDPPLHRFLEPIGLVLLQRMHVVEPPEKQQVGDLLDHLQRVRDTAGPERVPDLVNLGLDVACDHLVEVPNLVS